MINDIIKERTVTHGNFTDNSYISQQIKEAIWLAEGHVRLSSHQREALEMIAHKIGRILAGDPNHKDHWDDIAGYAKLVSERI